MRLIDADALRDKRQLVEVTDGSWRTTACVVLATDIDQAPTIEAEPVKHGRWELHGNDDNCGYSYFCSKCGASYDEDYFYEHGNFIPFNYCPNCGAKMDGDNNA